MTTQTPDLEPLSDAARSLLDSELAASDGPPPEVAARIFARVQETVAAPQAADPPSAADSVAAGTELPTELAIELAEADVEMVDPADTEAAPIEGAEASVAVPATATPAVAEVAAGATGGVSAGVTIGIVLGLALAGLSVVVAPPLQDHGARTVPGITVEPAAAVEQPRAHDRAPAEGAITHRAPPARPSVRRVPVAPAAQGPQNDQGGDTAAAAGQVVTPVAAPAQPAPRTDGSSPKPSETESSGTESSSTEPSSTEPSSTEPSRTEPSREAVVEGATVRGDKPRKPRRDLAAERKLLDAARTALSGGRANEALGKVREHRDEWPLGALRQEREALWVRALVAAGQGEAARRRGERFLRRHPGSIHRSAVQSALDRL